MKIFITICSLALISSVAHSADVDYKHCMGAVNSLEDITANFMEMDSEGKIKIKRESSSLKTEGDTAVYTDYSIVTAPDKKTKASKAIKATSLADIEIFRVRYEKVESGQPAGKIIGITYNVKDKKNSNGGQLAIDFSYKNGHCVPNTTKKSLFSHEGKVGNFFINTFEKIAPTSRSWDLDKCKQLHDYIETNKQLEVCLNSAPELIRLESIINDLNDKKAVSDKKEIKSVKKAESDIKKAFVTYSAAKMYIEGCEQSGYKDILSDKAYWEAIKTIPTEGNVEEKTTLSK